MPCPWGECGNLANACLLSRASKFLPPAMARNQLVSSFRATPGAQKRPWHTQSLFRDTAASSTAPSAQGLPDHALWQRLFEILLLSRRASSVRTGYVWLKLSQATLASILSRRASGIGIDYVWPRLSQAPSASIKTGHVWSKPIESLLPTPLRLPELQRQEAHRAQKPVSHRSFKI